MKNEFPGWYPRAPEELDVLWERAIFVPDTNILLHCLRHASEVREELLRILEVLNESLWVPHQVGLEFQRNRLDVEFGALDAYDRLIKDYETVLNQAKEKLRQMRAHPVISVEYELAALDSFLDEFKSRMVNAKSEHPVKALERGLERLNAVFKGRVGPKLTSAAIAAIKKEGEDRYAKQIPPGYKDIKKNGSDIDRFGDLIIWKDLLDKAKSDGRPIIFITDDVKEDWWHLYRGRKLGPRPELLDEFRIITGQDFHIYELGQFLRVAAIRYPEIDQQSVEQIEKSVLEDEEARRRVDNISEATLLQEKIASLESERETLISAMVGIPYDTPSNLNIAMDKASMRIRLADLDAELRTARAIYEPAGSETS